MKSSYLTITVLYLAHCTALQSQITSHKEQVRYVSLSATAASVEIHSQYVKNLAGTRPFGIELDIGRHDFTQRAIDTYGGNIRFGATVSYWRFNHEALGNGLALMGYAEPFLVADNRFMLSIKASAGINGLTRPYDETSNTQNLAYSTHVAFPLAIGLGFYLPLNYNWAIKLNASFNHFSNGGIKKPNYGLNYTALSLGLEHTGDKYATPPRSYSEGIKLSPRAINHFIEAAFSLALKDEGTAQDNQLVALHHTRYHRQLTRVNGLTAGILLETNFTQWKNDRRLVTLSPLAGHRFYLGKFSFSQELGYNPVNNTSTSKALFQMYTIDITMIKRFLIGMNLKAHGQSASYLGLRMGVFWK